MIIKYFKLRIEPVYFCLPHKVVELKISAVTNSGLEHRYQKSLNQDDLLSRFDRIFEVAKHELRRHIEKEE